MDPIPVVGHFDPDAPGGLPGFRPELDRRAVRRVLRGVREEVAQHLADWVRIRPYQLASLGLHGERMVARECFGEGGGAGQQLADRCPLELDSEVVPLDRGGALHVGDEDIHVVQFSPDAVENVGLSGTVEFAGSNYIG